MSLYYHALCCHPDPARTIFVYTIHQNNPQSSPTLLSFIWTLASWTVGVVQSADCCIQRRPPLRRSRPPFPPVVCPGCSHTALVPRTCTNKRTPGPRRHPRPDKPCARPKVFHWQTSPLRHQRWWRVVTRLAARCPRALPLLRSCKTQQLLLLIRYASV